MKLSEIILHPAYHAAASTMAKSYIFAFVVFCVLIGFVDKPNLGFWWVAVLGAGIFVASLAFAMPITGIKVVLAAKLEIVPEGVGWLLYCTIDLTGYVALWFATRYVIDAIGS